MVWRFTKTLAIAVVMLCIGCARIMGTTGTSSSTGAAVGEVGGPIRSVEDQYNNPSESWDTRAWDQGTNFGANPALGSPAPPGFNWPGGEGGDSGE